MPILLEPHDPLLNQRAKEIPIDQILSNDVQEIVDYMFSVARGERTDKEKRVMVGLAAPQVGISKRIIIVDVNVDRERKNLGELRAYINPEIIWKSEEQEEGREGCYSVDPRLWAIVLRSSSIEIKAWDRTGQPVHDKFSGFTARIFQHETDHLDGIRFPERVGERGPLQWVEQEQFSDYRNNWQAWPVKCPWHIWEAIRDGRPYTL